MTRIQNISVSVCALGLVAACGGTTVSNPAASFTQGPTEVTYDASSGALSIGGAAVATPRDEGVHVNGDAAIYRSEDDVYYTAQAENSDVFALVSANIDGGGLIGRQVGRNAPSTLTGDASGTFRGDYTGYYIVTSDGPAAQNITTAVTGDANLTVDIDASTISGGITNRMSLTRDGVALTAEIADVAISDGTIAANGTFAATATGGEWRASATASPYPTSNGQVTGVLGGSDGESAAGLLRFDVVSPSGHRTYFEQGAFIATRD